ncbi:MAG: FecR family protein [Usitatibacter sp.]
MNKTTIRQTVNRWLAASALIVPLVASAASGEFTFVVGDVSVTKATGQRATPVKGSAVDSGDRITTGANGMAQLTMVDNARLSLRPSTQFVIEQYADRRDSTEGAVLSLIRGTLRTFTGLIASQNRDRFVMKTRVATVGIRGSGNILYACDAQDCDASVTGDKATTESITVNHTIEGSHAITNIVSTLPSGTPAQQGGAQTLITGPGQTVLVQGGQPPRYIPTPSFIANAATTMAGAKPTSAVASGSSADSRNFSPSDTKALPDAQQGNSPSVGYSGVGFPLIDASGNLSQDPLQLQDVIVTNGSPFYTQVLRSDLTLEGNSFRSYIGYSDGLRLGIDGGTVREGQQLAVEGGAIILGRTENAGLSLLGGAAAPAPGSIHWIAGPSGYPPYLSDVLTGTAAYTLAAATSPTNQQNTVGTLGSAIVNVNFGNRTLSLALALSIPAAGGNAGGNWNMSADNVPISLNSFFGSTADRLLITNANGQSSRNNPNISGSFEGSFVGTGLSAAILGYGISDTSATNPANWNSIAGVAAFTGPHQDGAAPYREGRVSDSTGLLVDFIRSYSTTNRPDEVTSDADGRATAFSAPITGMGVHATYSIGSSQVVQAGFDPETGMIWGRWAGGSAQVTREGQSASVNLTNTSLHYIFAGTQSGPVALPLTGTATYDVIGSTSPTDYGGHVGNLNSATLNANFTNRTADASVNISINNQGWTGSASNMPIYRDQYFSSYSGTPIPGVPNPSPLNIACTPNCGQGASGSFDGFFTGRSGQRAGLMYNLGGNQGAVAFGRRGG